MEDLYQPSGAYQSQSQEIRGLYVGAGCSREFDVHYPQYWRAVSDEEEEYSNLGCDEKLWQLDFFCWWRLFPWIQYPMPKPAPGSPYWGYSRTARWLTGRNAPPQGAMGGMEFTSAYGNRTLAVVLDIIGALGPDMVAFYKDRGPRRGSALQGTEARKVSSTGCSGRLKFSFQGAGSPEAFQLYRGHLACDSGDLGPTAPTYTGHFSL